MGCLDARAEGMEETTRKLEDKAVSNDLSSVTETNSLKEKLAEPWGPAGR